MRTVLKRPEFRLLFIGTTASTIGDSLMLLVLAIWVKNLTGSSAAAGLTMFFMAAPSLLGPLAGWLVDKVPHRPFLIAANLINAVFLLPLAFVRDASDVWLIYLVAALLGAGQTVDQPALNGLLKLVLPDDLLVEANGANQTVHQGIRLLGPLAGAGLLVVGGGFAVAVVDLVSFLVAAAAIAALRVSQPAPEPAKTHWRAEVSAGFRHLLADGPLRRAATGMFLAACSIGALESVAFALVDAGLGRPPEFVSVIVSVMGVGGLTGGLLASRVVRRLGELGAEAGGLLLVAAVFAIWLVPSVTTVLIAAPLVGFALPIVIVADSTLVQRRSPADLVGRVSAANELCFSTPNLLSLAGGAALVSMMDYRFVLAGMAVVTTVAGGYLMWGRRLTAPSPVAPAPVPD